MADKFIFSYWRNRLSEEEKAHIKGAFIAAYAYGQLNIIWK